MEHDQFNLSFLDNTDNFNQTSRSTLQLSETNKNHVWKWTPWSLWSLSTGFYKKDVLNNMLHIKDVLGFCGGFFVSSDYYTMAVTKTNLLTLTVTK